MKYNPNIHHHRSIRLKGYDYSQAGSYFITICCEKRKHRFGEIVGAGLAPAQNDDNIAEMQLNEFGIIAYNEWVKLPERFPNFELDVFQIMPNHTHGIIVLTNVATGLVHTVGDMVGAYKSLVANACLDIHKSKWAGASPAPYMGKFWQRNYHEHIIRNGQSYQTISDYIINNPAKWGDDKFYTE